ncbi:hypothetical protein Zm00014a_022178, partial [Zea mays]
EKIDKRLQSWKGRALSIAGRITLINSCITNTPIYHMSMYLFPKTTVKKMTPSGGNFSGREEAMKRSTILSTGKKFVIKKEWGSWYQGPYVVKR